MKKSILSRVVIGAISLVFFVMIWDRAAASIRSPYLPLPYDVLKALISMLVFNQVDHTGRLMSEHISASVFRVLYGFVLAALVGVPVGLFTGWSWHVESATNPIIEVIRPIPPLAWIPFAIKFFGDPFNTVFIVFIGAIFPTILSTVAGVKAIDPILVDAAKTLGATRSKLFTKVVVPSSAPSITTGLRIGLGVGWMCIVAAEMVGVKTGGLGYYILVMMDIGRFENVFAGMILIGIIGFIMVTAMSYLERRLSKWARM